MSLAAALALAVAILAAIALVAFAAVRWALREGGEEEV